jgi:hypothetical protein
MNVWFAKTAKGREEGDSQAKIARYEGECKLDW